MTSPRKNVPVAELIDLSGRGAIVTGGASGIGLAICHRFAEAGAGVFIVDAEGEKARQACRELEENGYEADRYCADVSWEAEVRDMVDTAVTKLGSIDILVNCAGIYPRISLEKMTGDDFERVVAVNLTGTFLCGREVSQRMVAVGRGGSILNIASIDAVHPSGKGCRLMTPPKVAWCPSPEAWRWNWGGMTSGLTLSPREQF